MQLPEAQSYPYAQGAPEAPVPGGMAQIPLPQYADAQFASAEQASPTAPRQKPPEQTPEAHSESAEQVSPPSPRQTPPEQRPERQSPSREQASPVFARHTPEEQVPEAQSLPRLQAPPVGTGQPVQSPVEQSTVQEEPAAAATQLPDWQTSPTAHWESAVQPAGPELPYSGGGG